MANTTESENGKESLLAKKKTKYEPDVMMAAWVMWKNFVGKYVIEKETAINKYIEVLPKILNKICDCILITQMKFQHI